MTRKRANIMDLVPLPGEQRALKYDPEFCWTIRGLAQEGRFPEEWCAEIGVTMKTLYEWANVFPEFDEAVRIAWHLLNAYWTNYARDNLTNPNLRTTLLLEILRKRFPESWGKNARNTQETFETRNETPGVDGDEKSPLTRALKDAPREEIKDRIAMLQERMKHSEEK